MANQPFREAYTAAAKELESLLKEQERIEERILDLRKTMTSLTALLVDDADFMAHALQVTRELINASLTDDIHRIVSSASQPLTASEIRSELNQLNSSFREQSNPLATIHAIMARLAESGRVHETVKDGKKAWERMSRMAEAFAQAKMPPVYSSGMRGNEKPKTLGHPYKPGTYVDVRKKE